MSHEKPTPAEIRISRSLQRVARKLDKLLKKETHHECSFMLQVCLREGQAGDTTSYVSNVDRETASLWMAEALCRWEADESMPPLHERKDADGRTLDEILGDHEH